MVLGGVERRTKNRLRAPPREVGEDINVCIRVATIRKSTCATKRPPTGRRKKGAFHTVKPNTACRERGTLFYCPHSAETALT